MRKTSLDLDQESTIISMLAVRGLPVVDGASTKGFPLLKVLLTCVALLLVIAYVQGSPAWQ